MACPAGAPYWVILSSILLSYGIKFSVLIVLEQERTGNAKENRFKVKSIVEVKN
jgi:hypothetical protein